MLHVSRLLGAAVIFTTSYSNLWYFQLLHHASSWVRSQNLHLVRWWVKRRHTYITLLIYSNVILSQFTSNHTKFISYSIILNPGIFYSITYHPYRFHCIDHSQHSLQISSSWPLPSLDSSFTAPVATSPWLGVPWNSFACGSKVSHSGSFCPSWWKTPFEQMDNWGSPKWMGLFSFEKSLVGICRWEKTIDVFFLMSIFKTTQPNTETS